jgi:hypothetical protein
MPRPAFFGLVLALTAVFWPWSLGAQQPPLRLLGQFTFESGRIFQDASSGQDTTVGGLSGLAYDAKRGVYYAVCDDRGENQPPRYYTLEIDTGEGGIADVRVVGVSFFDSDAATPGIQPYERGDSDLEEIVLLADDTLLVSSERDRANRPWVRHFALDGTLLGEIAIPERFMPVTDPGPDGRPRVTRGIRVNLGFEGMTVTPAQDALYLVNEQALGQDGPGTTAENGSNVRILRMDLSGPTAQPASEYVYPVEKAFAASSNPSLPSDNGVSAMLWVHDALPQYDLLLMERAFAAGVGNDVNLYGVSLAGATDVRDLDALPDPFAGQSVKKTLLANITAAGVKPDNLEAVALGPHLPNGHQTLLVMSDDNFSAAGSPQINQFLLFEISPD